MYKVRVYVEATNYGQQIDVFVNDELVERYNYGYEEGSYDFKGARSYANVLKVRWEKRIAHLKNIGVIGIIPEGEE